MLKEYEKLQQAWDYFNEKLFDNELPPVFITYQRKRTARGYYSADKFKSRNNGEDTISELALNPSTFTDRTDLEVLSTLVHEMVHHKQHCVGKPPKSAYHNKEWAGMMESVGLMPSITGQEGGKRTGRKVSHYILEGGEFEKVASNLLQTGFSFNWEDALMDKQNTNNNQNKVKYSCDGCGMVVWGKPELKIVCKECEVDLNEM